MIDRVKVHVFEFMTYTVQKDGNRIMRLKTHVNLKFYVQYFQAVIILFSFHTNFGSIKGRVRSMSILIEGAQSILTTSTV